MNRELVWLTLPVVGFLSQLGGTFNKLFRRIGVPLVITFATWLILGWSWWWPVLFLSIFGVACLPVTLIGSSLKDSWVNWVWVWILGYLYGLPSALLSTDGFLLSLIPCVIGGLFITLSNIQATSRFFQWKFVEFAVWAAMAYPYALILS